MDLGSNIQAARKRAGLTQEQLAKKCNIATITIRQYESGKREPRIKQLQDIANALDTHILEFLGFPVTQKYEIRADLKFFVESIASNIHKKYDISEEIARHIVEDCYDAFHLDEVCMTKVISIGELFDALDPEDQKAALSYIRFLLKEDSPEESSGER